MTVFVLIQIILPVSVMLWLALWPLPSCGARLLQGLAAVFCWLGAALAGLWLAVPGVWVPVVGVALAALLVRAARQRCIGGVSGWAGLVLAAALTALGGGATGLALWGRVVPDVPVVDVASPLQPGRYLVANGGSTRLINAHLATHDPSVPRFAQWRGQSRAVDLVAVDRFGRRKGPGASEDPASYLIFGAPLVAPCAGRVVAAVDGERDMPVPEMDRAHMLGNHVILVCGEAHVVLAHFRQGSVAVVPGQDLAVGDFLGEVGNSGNSAEPHLHIHAQVPGSREAPIAAEPYAITIAGRYLVRNAVLRR